MVQEMNSDLGSIVQFGCASNLVFIYKNKAHDFFLRICSKYSLITNIALNEYKHKTYILKVKVEKVRNLFIMTNISSFSKSPSQCVNVGYILQYFLNKWIVQGTCGQIKPNTEGKWIF